jgi:cytochrome c biogenesis protein CcmG/thiol:disulfide interchange protein DsbE
MNTPQRSTNIALGVIGLGLLLVGVAGIVALISIRAGDALELSAVPVPVSYPPPSVTLYDVQGAFHSLADYRGQVVLVNLWATWCPPCRDEMPALQKYYRRHADQGFVIIAIEDGEPLAEVTEFVSDYHLTFPVWIDPYYQATQLFRVDALPSSYVIDRHGIVRLAWVGAINFANLEKYVTPLIEE